MQKSNLPTYILAFCALIIVALIVRKEFFVDAHQHSELQPVKIVEGIDTLRLGATHVGPEGAEVTIIEFFDYECPYCRKFQESVDYIRDNFEGRVQVRYVHFPLPNHTNAMEAAFAAECASNQNRFAEAHAYLFENQSKLDTMNWQNASKNIGIADGQEFTNCIENREPFRSVEGGIMAANQLGINSIPTFIINDKMYQGSYSSDLLEQLIQSEFD